MFKIKGYEEIKDYIRKNLSKARAQHCFNVADEAVLLAKKYGEDKGKAYTAGLLHDAKKEEKPEKLKQLVISSNIDFEPAELEAPQLWHAIAGSAFARDKFGVVDIDILNAIRYHTIAREGMSSLEKIIYLADMISKDRTYSGVEKMREYVYESLDKGMLEAIKLTIAKQIDKERKIPITTMRAYNYFISKREMD
ncbi:MAG: bis(5'-nucleosyl)-tetraphosphatase (symmetrical) YqeK [Oscillospiraceae bacterium]